MARIWQKTVHVKSVARCVLIHYLRMKIIPDVHPGCALPLSHGRWNAQISPQRMYIRFATTSQTQARLIETQIPKWELIDQKTKQTQHNKLIKLS